jgi:hypothetical protein
MWCFVRFYYRNSLLGLIPRISRLLLDYDSSFLEIYVLSWIVYFYEFSKTMLLNLNFSSIFVSLSVNVESVLPLRPDLVLLKLPYLLSFDAYLASLCTCLLYFNPRLSSLLLCTSLSAYSRVFCILRSLSEIYCFYCLSFIPS